MCILFLYNCDEKQSNDGYRLIIASNRDESWDRPTKPAAFWEDYNYIIGGVDLKSEISGGTWLVMSKKGKIGVSLNSMDVVRPDKRSRGRLATDFLTCDLSGEDYIAQHVQPVAKEYNSFNLLLLDVSSPMTGMTYFNNKDQKLQNVKTNIVTLDNGTLDNPWQKSINCKTRFEEIVKTYGTGESKDQLVSRLIDHLSDMQQYKDDDQLRKQAEVQELPEDIISGLSSCFVCIPSGGYGTRTNTIILVDHHGQCEFIERTLKSPIDPEHMEWETNTFKFQLKNN